MNNQQNDSANFPHDEPPLEIQSAKNIAAAFMEQCQASYYHADDMRQDAKWIEDIIDKLVQYEAQAWGMAMDRILEDLQLAADLIDDFAEGLAPDEADINYARERISGTLYLFKPNTEVDNGRE